MKIFVLEDDKWYAQMLTHFLSFNPDNDVEVFYDSKSLFNKLHLKPDLITIDLSLPDMSGEDVLKKVKLIDKRINVIIISAAEDVKSAIQLLKLGAYDYILKDNDTKDRLWKTISNLNEVISLQDEVEELKNEVEKKYDFSNSILGNSSGIKKLYQLIAKATLTNINVSITGETGTGKEMVAKAIHFNSDRKKKPFVAVNVTSIPKELLESELFGHEKGAFTGAVEKRIGKFEEANNGTLFLDEIGDLEITMQAKLLRVLQEREVVRVGSNKPIPLNIRIITATHKNLQEEVKNKNFREDLYFRLIGFPIELEPLRERGNDILILAKHYADLFCTENKITKKSINSAAQKKLLSYNYPGNIRELKAIIELAVVMSEGKEIDANDINFINAVGFENIFSKEKKLKEYETDIIQHFLDKYNYDVLRVAELLDISKSKIYKMIKENELTVK